MQYFFTLISGILTGLAMPGNLFSFIIWFSLVFFLRNMVNSKNYYQRFLHTIIFSASMLVTTLWWLFPTLTKNIPQVLQNYPSFLGFLGFVGMIILLILPYLIIWLLAELFHRKNRTYNLLYLSLFYSLAFTSAEILREFGDLAFTGGNLAYALYDHTGLIQLVSIIGPMGITFIIVFVNSLIAFDKTRNRSINMLIIFSFIYLLNFSIVRFLPDINYTNNSIKIGAIQTNIPQEIKYSSDIYKNYSVFSKNISDFQSKDVDLIVFPESSFLEDISNSDVLDYMKMDIQNSSKPVIIGYPRFDGENYFNSVWFYNEYGTVINVYDKIKLTPFAEFLPYEAFFNNFQMFKLLRYYSPGEKFNIFEIDSKKFGVQICFETYFPDISASQVKKGAGFLIAVTNDGWFNSKTALLQHYTQGIFRALETRRDFVQISNTGLTGSIDRYGRITNVFKDRQENNGILYVNYNDSFTIYSQISALLKVIILILALLIAIF
jgi:apolipoprotein N-acyltransferase